MPGMIVHQWLVSQLLAEPAVCEAFPAELDDEAANMAFYFGSVAPDMGMFPGATEFVSNAAHYVRSGELATHLIETARTSPERAFAWGWVSHCLADILFHPLVNRGASELLGRPRDHAVSYGEHPAAHVRVELGLDAAMLSRFPEPLSAWPDAGCAEPTVDHLTRAFLATYGEIDLSGALRASVRAGRRWSPWWIATAREHSRRFQQLPVGSLSSACQYWAGRTLTAFLPAKSGIRGLFRASSPSAWLIEEFNCIVTQFLQQFRGMLDTGTSSLPNANLDTGEVDSTPSQYPLALATMKEWERRKSPGKPTMVKESKPL